MSVNRPVHLNKGLVRVLRLRDAGSLPGFLGKAVA